MGKYTTPANNTLTTIFEPLSTLGGLPFYHQTLEYVDGSGNQFFADSGPTKDPSGSQLSNVASAVSAAATGNASSDPYGTLACITGTEAQIVQWLSTPGTNDGQAAFDSQVNTNNDAVTNTTSATPAMWAAIQAACSYDNSLGLAYSPPNQNSNSQNSTDLVAAGQAPLQFGIFHADWSPGASNILPTQNTKGSDDVTTTDSTSNGTTTTTVTEKMGDNSNDLTEITLTTTTGTNDGATVSHDGTNVATENDTYTNSTNWTDSNSGTSYLFNGDPYTSSETDTNGTVTAILSGFGASLVGNNVSVTNQEGHGDFVYGSDDQLSLLRSNIDVAGQDDTAGGGAGSSVLWLGWDQSGDTLGGQPASNTGNAAFGYGLGLVTGGSYGTYSGSGGVGC